MFTQRRAPEFLFYFSIFTLSLHDDHTSWCLGLSVSLRCTILGCGSRAASCVNLISGKYHVSETNIDGRRFRMFPRGVMSLGVFRCVRSRSKP